MEHLGTLVCRYCKHRYIVHNSNSTLYGPVMYTTCPLCKKLTKRNFGKMVYKQLEGKMAGSIEDASVLIHMAKFIIRRLN